MKIAAAHDSLIPLLRTERHDLKQFGGEGLSAMIGEQ
jgi:hypothetical protein